MKREKTKLRKDGRPKALKGYVITAKGLAYLESLKGNPQIKMGAGK